MTLPAHSIRNRVDDDHPTNKPQVSRVSHLKRVIEHAAHLLPAQGPITVFIHHNTLHAFEDLPFTDAVEKGARTFGCQPYLSEDRYREELRRGRIRLADLEAVLLQDLGARAHELVLLRCTRLELQLAMLQYPLRFGPSEELLWFVAETDALRRIRSDASAAVRNRLIAETRRWVMRDLRGSSEVGAKRNGSGPRASSEPAGVAELIERFGGARMEEWTDANWEAFTLQAMWRVCCEGVAAVAEHAPAHPIPIRHRDLLMQVTGTDVDLMVHELLVPFCGAFLDQGLARRQLPGREEGFFRSFGELFRLPAGAPDSWRHKLGGELSRLMETQIDALTSIQESLQLLGVPEAEWEDYVSSTLLALRGWAGILRFLEERPDRAVHPIPAGSLTEFLAIRLLLERSALEFAARNTIGYTDPLDTLREELRKQVKTPGTHSVEQQAFVVFQLAQVLGWSPQELSRLTESHWSTLIHEIEAFSAIHRRRISHLAYEHRFYTQTLDALAIHNRGRMEESPSPRFQAMFCIDEREESIRRHIEELAPDVVTFGIAGFYFVAMYYRGADDAHFVPLCPAVMHPAHWVIEKVLDPLEEKHERRAKTRRALGMASHQIHLGSRAFALGALLSAIFGVVTTAPLIARTLFPRLSARLRETFGWFVRRPLPTRLQLERVETSSGLDNLQPGFTLAEMTDIAERVLRDTGLTHSFSRLVLTFGHGSTSMNNPHESAHDCGACGGARGGPNGRAIAQILNDMRVREQLQRRGLHVPADTVFIGGMHNTSSEAVTFYDLDCLPESHLHEFEAARELIEKACDRDAHERCRRFESAPLTLSLSEARRHVEGRAEDLAQVRPEWGHATNAICIVGRRQRTRGLFMDRRAFLNSYDPTQDDAKATILTRILLAAVPVCAGISLEYYFSYVDNSGYGCGTKLPHNIAALLGVMDGAASDLRTGLPWQMVEIHEPVRILFVIETTPDTMLQIIDRNPEIARLVHGNWVQLATLDPNSPGIHIFRDGKFHAYEPVADQLPIAPSSVDWYRGWREHLEFAQIDGQRPAAFFQNGSSNHV